MAPANSSKRAHFWEKLASPMHLERWKTPPTPLVCPKLTYTQRIMSKLGSEYTQRGSDFAHTLGRQKTPLDLVFLTFLQVHTLVLTLGHPWASLGTKIAQNRPWNGQNYATCSLPHLPCLIIHLALAFLTFDPALWASLCIQTHGLGSVLSQMMTSLHNSPKWHCSWPH